MTWHADQTEGRPEGEKLKKLLADREKLVIEVETLGRKPPPKTDAGKRFHQEDLIALARKIKNIDKKLGRVAE